VTAPVLERVVLVGFMGSGKSTVGPILANALGWRFVDQDKTVEATAGLTVSEIFRQHGEARFRAMEANAAQDLLEQKDLVMASGGGWAAVPGRLSELPEGTAAVWLRVSAAEAVRRAQSSPGARPLLAGPDPVIAARQLLSERESKYGLAGLEVDTEARKAEDVAARIVEILVRRYPDLEQRLRTRHAQ
jgi:shikimate kinase